MKTLKSLLAFAMIALTLPLMATEDPMIQIKSKKADNRAIIVKLSNLQQLPTKMTLQSLDGETTYYVKTIRKHNGYRTKINLEKLPRGRYLFTVMQKGKAYKQVILLRENEMFVSEFSS